MNINSNSDSDSTSDSYTELEKIDILDSEKEIKPISSKKSNSKKSNWFFRTVKYTFILFFIIFGLGIITLNLPFTRKIILKTGLEYLNDYLLAKISISDIRFKNYNHISIDDILIITNKDNKFDTLAKVSNLELKFKFFKLFNNEIIIDNLKFTNSDINLIKYHTDSSWNFSYIVPPSQDTTITPLPNLIINAIRFEFINSSLKLTDYTVDKQKKHLDLSNMDLHKLNFDISVFIDLQRSYYNANIHSLSLIDNKSNFTIDDLKLNAFLSPSRLTLKNINIITDKSNIVGKVLLNNFDIFGTDTNKTLDKSILISNLKTENFYPIEFFDILDLDVQIGGKVDFDIDIKGLLNDLEIKKFRITSIESTLDLKGRLKDLLTGNVQYELTSNESDIYSNDIYNIVKYIPREDIPKFNHIDIKYLYVKGDTKKVKTIFDFDTKQGKAKGEFDIGFEDLKYNCDIKFEKLNLSEFFNNNLLISDLSGSIKADGKKFDPKKLNVDLQLNLNNSRYLKYDIGFLDLSMKADGKGNIKVEKLNFSSKVLQKNSFHSDSTISKDTLNILNPNKLLTQTNNSIQNNQNLSNLDNSQKIELKLVGDFYFGTNSIDYNFDLNLNNFNLAKYLDKTALPIAVTSKFEIKGQNFDLDNMILSVNNQTELIDFGDRAFIPFDFKLNMNNQSSIKILDFNSDFFDINLKGNYKLIPLVDFIALQNDVIANFVNEKINTLTPKLDTSINLATYEIKPIQKYENINCDMIIKGKDMSIISAFIPGYYFDTKFDINLNINSLNTKSSIDINKFTFSNFYLSDNKFKLKFDTLDVLLNFSTNIINEIPELKSINFNSKSQSPVIFDNNEFEIKNLNLLFNNNNLKFENNIVVNNFFKIITNGDILINNENLEFDINEFNLGLGDSIIWRGKNNLIFNNKYNSFNFKSFDLVSNKEQELILKGSIDFQTQKIDNLLIEVNEYLLTDLLLLVDEFDKFNNGEYKLEFINKQKEKNLANNNLNDSINNKKNKQESYLFQDKSKEKKGKISGLIKNAKFVIDGGFEDPTIKINSNINKIIANGEKVGDLTVDLNHQNSNIEGNLEIKSQSTNLDLIIDVNALPINLGISNKNYDQRVNKKKNLDIDINLKNLALRSIENYVPAISDLNGTGDLNLNINGYLPDNLNYNGNAKFENVNFLVDQTNIRYKAEGTADISKELITLNDFKVFNYENDLKNGEANVEGTVKLKGLDIDELDIRLDTKNFLVLNQKAKKTLRWIYGDLRIATGNQPIRFYGTLSKPNVTGDIDVKFGNLVMPQEDISQIIRSQFNYKIINTNNQKDAEENNYYNYNINKKNQSKNNQFNNSNQETDFGKDTSNILANESDNSELMEIKEKEAENINQITNFSDLINYDLNIKIPGSLKVNMQINSLIELFAEITTKDANRPLKYIKKRENKEPKFYGEITVQDNSRMSFVKSFKTSGNLYFPTGNLLNPNLDLEANYRGRTNGSNPKEFLVNIKITGTKEEPIIYYSYILDGNLSTGDQSQILQDVISLLTIGNIKGRTGSQSGFDINRTTNDLTNSVLSDVFSKQLNQVLAKSGLNAEINFENGNLEQANIRISGQVLNVAQLSYGGRLSDINSANEIEMQVPFAALLDIPLLRDIILQASYTNTLNTIQTQDQKIWEVKLKLGGSK